MSAHDLDQRPCARRFVSKLLGLAPPSNSFRPRTSGRGARPAGSDLGVLRALHLQPPHARLAGATARLRRPVHLAWQHGLPWWRNIYLLTYGVAAGPPLVRRGHAPQVGFSDLARRSPNPTRSQLLPDRTVCIIRSCPQAQHFTSASAPRSSATRRRGPRPAPRLTPGAAPPSIPQSARDPRDPRSRRKAAARCQR